MGNITRNQWITSTDFYFPHHYPHKKPLILGYQRIYPQYPQERHELPTIFIHNE